MLREVDSNLARRVTKKSLYIDCDRAIFDAPDTERQFLNPIDLIDAKATGCRRDREVSVPLSDFHESMTCIRRRAWPFERRYQLIRLALGD
jgi:hypothetical protein